MPEGCGLHNPALSDMDFHNRASSDFSSNIVSRIPEHAFRKWPGQSYRPRPRPTMISFWISVVPPEIAMTGRWVDSRVGREVLPLQGRSGR
jgi:hypothetical protein